MYTRGKTATKKVNYGIYLRVHGVGSLDPWTTGFASLTATELKTNNGSDQADWADSSPTYVTGDFGRIGFVEEAPTITGSEGEEQGVATGDSITISEMMESAFNDLEFTKANYEALRALAKNGYVDVLFYDSDNASATVGAREINLKVFPNISGNALSKIEISFKKEVADIDTHFAFITMS